MRRSKADDTNQRTKEAGSLKAPCRLNSALSIHGAVLLFGLAGVIGRAVSLPAVIVTLGRVVFSAVFLLLYLAFRKRGIRLDRKRDIGLMAVSGVILAAHWTTFLQSVQVSGVAVGTITFSTFPIFVTFLEPVFFREKLRLKNVLTAALMLLGVLIMAGRPEPDTRLTEGIMWGMGGSVTYAVLTLTNRKLSAAYDGGLISFYEQSVAAIVLLPALLILKPTFTVTDLAALLLLGILCTAVAHSLFISGLRRVKAQTAGIISGMEPVYGIALAFLLLQEVPGIPILIGGAIILGTSLFSTFAKRESPAAGESSV